MQCVLLYSCQIQKSEHLVIDAGSSGTRFCRFDVHKRSDGSCQAVYQADVLCHKNETPLAEASKIQTIHSLHQGLQQFPANKNRSVALLATGGFRKLDKQQQAQKKSWIDAFFKENNLKYKLHILSGVEEGQLAHRTIQEMFGIKSHVILESGGATVQLAARNQEGKLQAFSSQTGINQIFNALRLQPGFNVCYNPEGQQIQTRARDCIELIGKHIQVDPGIQKMVVLLNESAYNNSVETYALGASWKAILDYADTKDASQLLIKDTTERYCRLSSKDIAAEGIAMKYARRACYLLSYGTALLETIGIEKVRYANESWPRGAAVSGEYFTDCK